MQSLKLFIRETSDLVSTVFLRNDKLSLLFVQSQMMTLKISSYPSVHSAGMQHPFPHFFGYFYTKCKFSGQETAIFRIKKYPLGLT